MQKTNFGRSIRATSNDTMAAELMGVNTKRAYSYAMIIAMVTAAIAGALVGSTFTFNPASGTSYLIIAFGVVVIGGMGSLIGTLLGGVVLGVASSWAAISLDPASRCSSPISSCWSSWRSVPTASWSPAPASKQKGSDGTMTLLNRTGKKSPIGLIVGIIILVVLLVLPAFGSSNMLSILSLIFIYMAMGQMWNLMGGYAGLLSLGMQAFIGIGGYCLAVFSVNYGINIYVAILMGAVFSVLFGLAVSPALFKMTGVYFAIGSWVVAEALLIAFSNWKFVRYAQGIGISTVYQLSGTQIYYTAMALGVVAVLVVLCLMRSKTGLALMAIRDSAGAAEAMGVPIYKTKIKCYMIACFFTGLAGGVMFMHRATSSPPPASLSSGR